LADEKLKQFHILVENPELIFDKFGLKFKCPERKNAHKAYTDVNEEI